jgi:adenylyltransferase/sulfurtransferase
MNPFIEIEAVPTSINSYTASKLVRGIDVVVDGLDTLKPRLALNRACIDANVPYIFGSAITNVGSVSTIIPNETACLECWHIGIDESKIPTCATVGVTPSIISLIASIEVSEVIRILIGKKANLAGKLLFCDLNDITFEKLDLVRSDECPSCGKIVSRIKPEIIEEICGRNGKRVFIVTPNRELTLDPFIKINKLNDLGFTPIYTSSYGVTFCSVEENKKAIKGSIFNTGVFVIEGLDSKELVLDIYKNITGIKLNTD